jgi:predicted transcriptional regulator
MRARRAAGEIYRDIAADYGVSPTTIAYAIRGDTWKHIQSEYNLPKGPRKGEQHSKSVLTEAAVLNARARRATGESYPSIAASYGVSRLTIADAVRGKTWKHVKAA